MVKLVKMHALNWNDIGRFSHSPSLTTQNFGKIVCCPAPPPSTQRSAPPHTGNHGSASGDTELKATWSFRLFLLPVPTLVVDPWGGASKIYVCMRFFRKLCKIVSRHPPPFPRAGASPYIVRHGYLHVRNQILNLLKKLPFFIFLGLHDKIHMTKLHV